MNKTLGLVIKNEKNIKIIENNIKKHYNEDELNSILYEVCNDIQLGISLNDILNNIKNKKYIWNHYSLKNIINKQDEQDDFLVSPFQVEEGVEQCKKCKSFRVMSYQRQDRSADEPMTTYCTCSNCGTNWKYSG